MYTYDDAGNLLTKKEYALTAASATPTTLYSTVTYGYNDAEWGDLLTSYGGDSITYDEIGNPIKIENPDNYGNEIFMEWDGRELTQYYVSSIVPYNICTYTYNDEGIRTSKTVDGVTHYYYLSGSQIIAEEWGNILCLYLYDADGSPIGMQYRTTSMAEDSFYTYWFEKNLQGDIVAVYSDSGVKLRTYTYDAWGNVTETVLTQAGTHYYAKYNPFRYRGYYYDTETGLYYLQSRYYNPEWGRFLNADGYVSTGTGLLGYNMFAYCNNNPVMFIDPTGDFPWLVIGIIVAVVTAVVAIPTTVNHIVNAVNYSKIDDELQDSYTEEEGIEEIEKTLSEYDGCKVYLNESGIKIENSYKVNSRYDRQKVSEILNRMGITDREYDNMSAEWLGHNVTYWVVPFTRDSTKSVDLEYTKDPRPVVNAVTKIMEILGWE